MASNHELNKPPSATRSQARRGSILVSRISVLPWISKQASAALEEIRIFTVRDILRARPEQLQNALDKIGMGEQAQPLRSIASLLQVQGMTIRTAKVMIENNIHSPFELSLKKLSEVQDLISESPDTEENAIQADDIASMLCDATVLAHTGAIMGVTRDKEGRAIQGATVTLGAQRQLTDKHGRFDLRRVPLCNRGALLISHENFIPFRQDNPQVLSDPLAVGVCIFVLGRLPATQKATPPLLSELSGDILPVPAGEPVREVMGTSDDFREGDLLRWQMTYRSGKDVKLVSRFKTYHEGVFSVHVYRVPRSLLPNDATIRDHFRWRHGSLAAISLDPDAFERERLHKRMTRHFRDHDDAMLATHSRSTKRALLARVEHLAQTGAFQGIKEVRK